MPLRVLAAAVLVLLAVACSAEKPSPPAPIAAEAAIDLNAVPAFTRGDCGVDSSSAPGRGLCDPIDLVFPDASFALVTGRFIAAGWSVIGLGSVETVIEPGTSEVLQPAVQLFETEGQGIAAARYHVRLWQLANGDTVGAVHHETGGTEHSLDMDWEAAEDRVVRDLCTGSVICSDGNVIAEQQRQQNNTDRWRGLRNDARPAVIRLTQPS